MSALQDLSKELAELVDHAAGAVVAVGRRGSGVVIGTDLVLTNAHNLREPTTVTFAGGREVEASLAGLDPDGDLAVLRAPTGEAQPLAWAEAVPAVGEIVVGLARPGGSGLRAGAGVVAGTGLSFRGPEGRPVRGALEHTAQLAPGSSGGPLLDVEGRLVGINTHRHREGAYLTIPVSAELHLRVDALSEGRSPQRRRLGIAIAPRGVARKLRQAVGLPEREGILVHEVDAQGPAAAAGMRRGDFIVAVDGEPVADVDQLAEALQRAPGDATVRVKVTALRGAEQLDFDVVFGSGPAAEAGTSGGDEGAVG